MLKMMGALFLLAERVLPLYDIYDEIYFTGCDG